MASAPKHTLYNLYIFNRDGVCLHYFEWYRPSPPHPSVAEDAKLMFGLLFSLKAFVSKTDPTGDTNEAGCFFRKFRTCQYALHFLESPSGIRFALNTSPTAPDMKAVLRHIYSELYVEHVMKNPLHDPNQPFKSLLFTQGLEALGKQFAA
mmetsp:Transcript_9324/g.34192  ORF Transcript_9324/g.34192 Transcript_9324/m.34192 type:complete len:150 (-) Transcript_9324:1229-1678(-)